MKNHLALIVLLLSLHVSAQKVDGFYSGILHNDSTGMTQQYELAIASYKGKISGYSYVTFVARDTFYWGIRKVSAQIIGDSLVVEDGKFVEHNFPEAPAKRVGRVITIPLNGQDSVISLNGRWTTNQTKRYYAVPGSIELAKSTDSAASPLIRHLKELRIVPDASLAAVDEAKKTKNAPVVMAAAPPTVLSYRERRNVIAATILFESDSLQLSFYDNGTVDGDTVSVYLNEAPVIREARLRTVAVKQMIAVKGFTELTLQLVAENLGTIPPNTGLLIITDGKNTHQVHFSADLATNATIVLRKKS